MSSLDEYYSLKEVYDSFKDYDTLMLNANDSRLECRTFTIGGISHREGIQAVIQALTDKDLSRVILEAADAILYSKLMELKELATIEANEFLTTTTTTG